jgi:hypothetical protein
MGGEREGSFLLRELMSRSLKVLSGQALCFLGARLM